MTKARSPFMNMYLARKQTGTLFSTMPQDVMNCLMSIYMNSDILAALSDAARGDFDALKEKLEAAKSNKEELKQLLTQRGDTVTRSGLRVMGTTLLECAFCGFDTRMVEMIKPYFDLIDDGEKERDDQLARCKKALEKLENKKPY